MGAWGCEDGGRGAPRNAGKGGTDPPGGPRGRGCRPPVGPPPSSTAEKRCAVSTRAPRDVPAASGRGGQGHRLPEGRARALQQLLNCRGLGHTGRRDLDSREDRAHPHSAGQRGVPTAAAGHCPDVCRNAWLLPAETGARPPGQDGQPPPLQGLPGAQPSRLEAANGGRGQLSSWACRVWAGREQPGVLSHACARQPPRAPALASPLSGARPTCSPTDRRPPPQAPVLGVVTDVRRPPAPPEDESTAEARGPAWAAPGAERHRPRGRGAAAEPSPPAGPSPSRLSQRAPGRQGHGGPRRSLSETSSPTPGPGGEAQEEVAGQSPGAPLCRVRAVSGRPEQEAGARARASTWGPARGPAPQSPSRSSRPRPHTPSARRAAGTTGPWRSLLRPRKSLCPAQLLAPGRGALGPRCDLPLLLCAVAPSGETTHLQGARQEAWRPK